MLDNALMTQVFANKATLEALGKYITTLYAMYQTSLGGLPWNTAEISDYDDQFNATMLDAALVGQVGANKATLEALNKYITTLYAMYQMSLMQAPWNTTRISDYDDEFNATMLDAALVGQVGANRAALEGLNNYLTTLYAIYEVTLGLIPWDILTITDYDDEFNTTMIGVGLAAGQLNIDTLGGRDSELFRDTLISVALSPDNLVETLTSGKLDGFVDKTELALVGGCEQAGLNASTTFARGTEEYNDFCVNAVGVLSFVSLFFFFFVSLFPGISPSIE